MSLGIFALIPPVGPGDRAIKREMAAAAAAGRKPASAVGRRQRSGDDGGVGFYYEAFISLRSVGYDDDDDIVMRSQSLLHLLKKRCATLQLAMDKVWEESLRSCVNLAS